jgi:UDP-N-acetylmuramoylalanine--D-glutamate ligase
MDTTRDPHVMDSMAFAGKRVTIMGLGFFGGAIGLAKYLVAQGAQVTLTDLKPAGELQDSIAALMGYPVRLVLGRHELADFTDVDAVFASPAVHEASPYLMTARTHGIPIDTEMNLFMRLCRGTVVGVTGSNGKTTTTSLIGAILQAVNPRTRVGDIALLLNLSPNHLDRHGSMEAYLAAKQQIFAYQGSEDIAILNADDPRLRPLAAELHSQLRFFSLEHPVDNGAYLDGERLLLARSGDESEVCRREDIPLLGRHNVANVLAAVAAADAWGVPAAVTREVIRAFPGVEHRLEYVREVRGVRFYNDSIATSPAATMAALAAILRPVWLIAGGYDKGLPFQGLGEAIVQRAKGVFLMGKTATQIARAIETAGHAAPTPPLVTFCQDLPEAVYAAYRAAKPGDIVLLSPACASYDQFRNFVERGRLFKQLVSALETS